MNLVKAQRMAESLPIPKLQEYANGLNPSMIPPWVATGVMQAKTKAEEMESNMQGAAQGPQPSVKEQVEQKAGLMALQMAPQQPQMQAGLDQLPSNIQMAGGGIVAFQEGGKAPKYETPYDRMNRKNREASEELKPLDAEAQKALEAAQRSADRGAMLSTLKKLAAAGYDVATLIPRAAMGVTEDLSNTRLGRALGVDFQLPASAYGGNRASMTPMMDQVQQEEARARMPAPAVNAEADAETEKLKRLAAAPKAPVGQGINTNVSPNLIPANLRPAVKPPMVRPPMAAPAAMPNTSAAPAAPAPDSMEAMFRQALGDKPKERTIEEQLAEQKAIRTGAGLDEEAGKNKLARIAALNQQFESSKPTGLQELIQMFGQAGRYKGLSGLAPAYTGIEAQKRAANLAHAKQINELMGAVEDTQRGEKTTLAGEVGKGREKDLERGALFGRERLQGLGNARGQDLTAKTAEEQRKTQERGQDLNYKAAMAQVSATAARNNMELTANQRAAIADKALDNVNSTLKTNMKLQMAVGNNPALMQQLLRAETERLMAAASGATMPTAPSAGSPSGTNLKYNPKTGKIE